MSSFLNAARGSNESRIPVWFMRQAGRYLPEYLKVREKSDFHTMSHEPELIKEITLQPLERFDLDAAILFSDILTPLEYMGSGFSFTDKGPILEKSGPDALCSLNKLDPNRDLKFVKDAISSIKSELNDIPLIGFVGAPFTLASYLIEGGTSREFAKTRTFLMENSKSFDDALLFLGLQMGEYLKFQIEAGVDAVQIFDSWVGILSCDDYEKHILPSIDAIVSSVKPYGVPITLYSQPTLHLLPMLVQTGVDVLSVDWRVELIKIASELRTFGNMNLSLQGNLDPLVLTMDWEQAKPYVKNVCESVRSAEFLDRFIFNTGHGLTPKASPETVKQTIDFIHNFR